MFLVGQVGCVPTGSGLLCFYWVRLAVFLLGQVGCVSAGSGSLCLYMVRLSVFLLGLHCINPLQRILVNCA